MEPEWHPLINKIDSPHYDTVQKEPTIKRFERQYTVRKLMDWAEITAAKYADPARANKGEEESDKRKHKTYIDYFNTLLSLALKDPSVLEMSAEKAYKKHGVEFRYT